jgi:hypothetical protein
LWSLRSLGLKVLRILMGFREFEGVSEVYDLGV